MLKQKSKITANEDFIQKNFKPMPAANTAEPFNSSEYFFELKWDGVRCLAYFDQNSTTLIGSDGQLLQPMFPELKDLYKQVMNKCVLDGELIIFNNGKQDIVELQRRIKLTNESSVIIMANRYPAAFVAYDILYLKGKTTVNFPLAKRKKLLLEQIQENKHLIITRYISTDGIHLFNMAKKHKLKGVVAKKMDSIYDSNNRSGNWLNII